MKTIFLILFAMLPLRQVVLSQDPLLINAYNRNSTSLNGEWNYIVDPYENGYYNYRYQPFDVQQNPSRNAYFTNSKATHESDLLEYNFDAEQTLNVPGDWNTQKENLFYYEGTIWYKKSFDYDKKNTDNKVHLYFGASNYKTEVYINGKKLGTHEGGFTPFNFDITNFLNANNNFLVVKVDNKRKRDGVPTLNTDWWNYGGITRDVMLVETSETYVQDYFLHLDPKDNNIIKGQISLQGSNKSNQSVRIQIPQLAINLQLSTNNKGVATFNTKKLKINYWSPDNPFLYNILINTEGEQIDDQIGFRSITTRGKEILLNGQKVFLKGICVHEEKPILGGRANSITDAQQILEWVKELGGNYVRLSHYPHNEHIIRLADKMGIMVWEEIPVYWTIQWDNTETYDCAESQLTSMISRDKNRASVIIWSMANETPTSEPRNIFLENLSRTTRNLDPTRLISAALEQTTFEGDPKTKTISDPFADVVDILSFNQYIGWYDGLPEKCKEINWKIPHNKPVIVSEFGAGAKQGLHGPKTKRWTEEYQEYLYKETLKMVSRIDQLAGLSPWILTDFRSPRRPLPNIQDGWNRKGLISDSGEKKKAFWTLKTYYDNLSN